MPRKNFQTLLDKMSPERRERVLTESAKLCAEIDEREKRLNAVIADISAQIESLRNYIENNPDADDWRSAGLLIETLRKTHIWCCVEIKSDFDYVWDVKMIKFDHDDEAHEGVRAHSESLTLAVCAAAEKAIERLLDQ